MFNFFKRKDKATQEEELIPWGMPDKRKMSKDEAARDEAEQRLVEKNNKERRDMYRLAGAERIFNDSDGRRLALRSEDNSGLQPNPEHPPFSVTVFWGVRELGHINAEMNDPTQMVLKECVVERGYEGRGIAAEMLNEIVAQARQKNLKQLVCAPPTNDNPEWTTEFLASNSFSPQGNQLSREL